MINFELVKKYWIYVLSVILLIILFFMYNNTKDLEGKNSKLQGNVLANQSLSNFYLSQVNAKEDKIISYKKKIDSLDVELNTSQEVIDSIKASYNIKIKEVNKLNTIQIAKYFKDRYHTIKDVDVFGDKVTLKDTISKQCISDLIKGDANKAELKEVYIVNHNLQSKVTFKDSIINTLDNQKKDLFKVIDLKDNSIKSQEEIINNDVKILNKEKNKSTLYKITTVASLLLGGYILLK